MAAGLKNNPGLNIGLTSTFAVAQDALLITQLVFWSLYGKSWRYPIAITFIYVLALFFEVRKYLVKCYVANVQNGNTS